MGKCWEMAAAERESDSLKRASGRQNSLEADVTSWKGVWLTLLGYFVEVGVVNESMMTAVAVCR